MKPDQAETACIPTPAANANGDGHSLRAVPRPDPPLLWTPEQAAAALNISPRSLKRMVADDTLPPGAAVKIRGRRLYSRLVLEDWCRAGCPAVRTNR